MRKMIIAAVTLGTMLLGVSAFAVNSGAGVRGLPGTESGLTQRPSGTLSEHVAMRPDDSGVRGLPGTESGPAVRPSQIG